MLVKQSELQHVKVKEESHHSSISTFGGKYIRHSNLFNLTLGLLCSHRACPSYTLYEIKLFNFQCFSYTYSIKYRYVRFGHLFFYCSNHRKYLQVHPNNRTIITRETIKTFYPTFLGELKR